MGKHTSELDIETQRSKEKLKHIVHPIPKEKQGTSQWSHRFYYKEKLPMAWGRPQQTE